MFPSNTREGVLRIKISIISNRGKRPPTFICLCNPLWIKYKFKQLKLLVVINTEKNMYYCMVESIINYEISTYESSYDSSLSFQRLKINVLVNDFFGNSACTCGSNRPINGDLNSGSPRLERLRNRWQTVNEWNANKPILICKFNESTRATHSNSLEQACNLSVSGPRPVRP